MVLRRSKKNLPCTLTNLNSPMIHCSRPVKSRPNRLLRCDDQHWLKQADEHRRTGITRIRSVLFAGPRGREINRRCWIGQVQMLVQLNEYPQAELWGRKSLEFFPNNPICWRAERKHVSSWRHEKRSRPRDGALQQQGETAYRWLVRGGCGASRRI